MAQVYIGQGKYVEAEPVYLQALKIFQTVRGEFHADVAATLNNLGVLHCMRPLCPGGALADAGAGAVPSRPDYS
jgi:hypothetical protein